MRYCKRLRILREEHDITQKQMAKILHITITTLSHYEMGLRELPIRILLKYAKHFNISTDYILGLTKNNDTIN